MASALSTLHKRGYWKALPMSAVGLVSRVSPVQTALRNCTRDEGRSFEVGNQVLISSHRKLLLSKAIVVNVVEGGGREYPAVSHGNGTAGRRKLGWRVNSGNPGGRRPQHQSRRSQSGPVIGVFPLSPES